MISHPDQNLVTNFHARPDLKCSLTPARVMPFKATTARAPGAHGKGAASVNRSQGAAFGANFQPTLQAPPPGGVQSPASFAAPQLTSSSTVSTILPSDSASVIHADLQGNSALTGSVTRTGLATYYQNMTNTSGRSDSGFHPPSANMATVRRPVALAKSTVMVPRNPAFRQKAPGIRGGVWGVAPRFFYFFLFFSCKNHLIQVKDSQ